MKKETKTEKKTEKKEKGSSAISKIKKSIKKDANSSIKEEKIKIEDPFSVVKFVLMTEKSVQSIELQNKLVFVVSRKSNRNEISRAVESIFEKQISGVKTLIDQKGRKRAFVKFTEPGTAGDIAVKLGII